MSGETAEQTRSGRRSVSLSLGSLYLDPNNYRFLDHPDYRRVPPERVFDADVQRRTTGFVLGRHQENVRDLVASIKANGWLDIDPILVESRDKGRFLVVEGNRRVATLKHLQRRYEEDAVDLGKLDASTFSRLPVVLYRNASERDHLVMMGLHHISGKRRWPAINRARAMERLLSHFGGDADAVCEALGVSKRELNLSIRTLALVKAYKESDYGDQLQSEQYNLFREVLKSEAMRTWLGWDPAALAASRQSNLNRLFSWMSREAESDDGEEDGRDAGIGALSDPVITTGGQVRELAKIIEDPEAVRSLDETRSLQEATLSSDLLVKSEIEAAFKSCEGGIQKLDRRIGELAPGELDRVEQLIGRLQGMMLARKNVGFGCGINHGYGHGIGAGFEESEGSGAGEGSGGVRPPPAAVVHRLPWQPFNEITQSQFSSIRIESYRGIDGLVLDAPGRINLIVGVNNAGKTSLLEAIYLLAHQNDERALLDTILWRGRIEGEPPPMWLVEQLPRAARVSGSFDQVPENGTSVELKVDSEPGPDVEDQTSFLSKLAIESSYERRIQSTDVVFFADRPRRTRFQGRRWLCRSAFTSPFSANRPETLARCNKESLEAGTKQRIIDFIRDHVDSGLRNIELADRYNRFLVSHRDFRRALDLAAFGEGVRRVFETGLLFAGVGGGVLLVDEFENAIHTELLMDFTRLVQDLAAELNVQVFLSTHSKEAIDAFVLNECRTDDIVGYAISRTGNGATARRYEGSRLKSLHDAVDFDLRGVR